MKTEKRLAELAPGDLVHSVAGTDLDHALRVTEVRTATIRGTVRPDYPVQGTKTKKFEQIGNAIPPRLAWHILRTVILPLEDAGKHE